MAFDWFDSNNSTPEMVSCNRLRIITYNPTFKRGSGLVRSILAGSGLHFNISKKLQASPPHRIPNPLRKYRENHALKFEVFHVFGDDVVVFAHALDHEVFDHLADA
jgi:hypothetical protein